MKKVTMIFAAVALTFAVASCGSKTTEEAAAVDSAVVVEADTTAVDSAAVAVDSTAVEAIQ
jgi:predicted small lipoprotein YifL